MKNNYSTYHKGHDPFISRVQHWIQCAHDEYKPVVTYFLSPVEKDILEKQVGKQLYISFDGGYPQAQRTLACLCAYETESPFDYVILQSQYDTRYKTLTHKDILGALMHAGLERNFIGDLLVEKDTITIVAKQSLSRFIQEQITSIGRCSVSFSPVKRIENVSQRYKEITIHIASLRLDALVAQLAHCSRTQATKIIRSGYVKVNDVVVEENCQLCNNNFVSIRKVGRFQLLETISQTRKGRLVIRINQFM